PTLFPLFPYTTLFRSEFPAEQPALHRFAGRRRRDPRARRRSAAAPLGGQRPRRAGGGPRPPDRAALPRGRLAQPRRRRLGPWPRDRKSTRLNSSHVKI